MMDDPERVILDISSDEEVGFVKNRGGDGGGGGGGRGSNDYDWITELLGEGGDGRSKDDSDDVVVVGEVIVNPKQNLKLLTNADDDDDDCVVLEEDPDKPVEVENDRGDDSDELLVVSEKGQTIKTAYVGRERKMGSLQSNHATPFCSIHTMQHQFWPWKKVWKSHAPYKVQIFIWLVCKNACLTQWNLQRRGMHICCRALCEEQPEDTNHLFLHCNIIAQLWDIFFCHRGPKMDNA